MIDITNEYAEKVAIELRNATGWQVDVCRAAVNNGVTTELVITKDSSGIHYRFDVPSAVSDLTWDDISDDDIIDAANELIGRVMQKSQSDNESSATAVTNVMRNKEEFLNRVFLCLVNGAWNKDAGCVLKSVADDLAYIFKISLEDITGTGSSVLVRPEHIVYLGITEEELFEVAYENTKKNNPPKIRSISDYTGFDMPDDIAYVVSNEKSTLGAVAVTYPEVLSKLKKLLGETIYIIPSSIHECIAINPMNESAKTFASWVKEVNATMLPPKERLSDHVYKIDDEGHLVNAED